MKHICRAIVVAVLQLEARLILQKYRPKIVAVTGSVGKTSTKDALFVVLSREFHARKSEKSYNSDIGVLLTILGVRSGWTDPFQWFVTILRGLLLILHRASYPEWLVLEVGADRPGDIRRLSRFIKPDIVVVTQFARVPAHIEFFRSREELINEKAQLVRALGAGGTLITNADDEDALHFSSLTRGETLTYGFSADAVVRCIVAEPLMRGSARGELDGMHIKAALGTRIVSVQLRGAFGRVHAYPVLAALALARLVTIDIVEASEALSEYVTPPGRMHLIPGIRETTILDDTYNSSPIAAHEALQALSSPSGARRRVAVLGDMLELGLHAADAHRSLGTFAARATDVLVTVGLRARGIAEGARAGGMREKQIYHFEDSWEAGAFLKVFIEHGDLVLVKGSQAMRMERVVEAIMAHPEEKERLLVRQELEWKTR